jgi:hypothetical protein
MTHRLAARVRDGDPGGGGRFWREFGGFAIDPAGSFTRLLDGDMFGPPPPQDPTLFYSKVGVTGTFGARTTYEGHIPDNDTTSWYANFRFDHGEPFQRRYERPFDVFTARVQLNGKEATKIGLVSVAGLLARKPLASGRRAEHMLGAAQHYDYVNNRAFELGGQSLGAHLYSRFGAAESRYRVETNLAALGILLAATKSDYVNQTGRSYDYGPGYGAAFSGALMRDDWDILRLSHVSFVIHSVNGNRADHHLSLSSLGLSLPLTDWCVLDADYSLYLAEREYRDFPDVSQRSPELLFGVRARL